MPPSLVESAIQWSDVQSLVSRTGEKDVTFRFSLAKKFLTLANSLYKWYRHRHNAAKALEFPPILLAGGTYNNILTLANSYLNGSSCLDITDDFDGIETADLGTGGEEESDIEGVMDQDTETEELPLDGDMDDPDPHDDDNSDIEGDLPIAPGGPGLGLGLGGNGGGGGNNNNGEGNNNVGLVFGFGY